MSTRKLFIADSLGLDDRKVGIMSGFIVYCTEKLPVRCDFEIHLIADRGDGKMTTGVYIVGDHVVKVYAKSRALADVMRSVAHEMTHMMQDESGMITGPIQDAGGFHEDQANAKAGELLKTFARDTGDRSFYDL
jgi:hypothetical protein